MTAQIHPLHHGRLHQIRDGHGRGKQGGRDRGEGHFFRMVL
jgi:hypothetical protein